MNAPIPSGFRRHRTLLLVSAGVVWLLVLLALMAWWLLPRWAPNFVIRYSPMPDMVFRAATEGKAPIPETSDRLTAMGDRATAVMLAQLRHSDETARSLALTVLGRVKDPQATEAVIAVLNDPREMVRAMAMETLGKIGDPRAITALVPFLHSGNRLSDGHAVKALQLFPHASVADVLHPLLADEDYLLSQNVLHQNLDPRVPAWLDEVMRSSSTTGGPPEYVAFGAAHALGRNPQTAALELLLSALRDPSPMIRKCAHQGLKNSAPKVLPESTRQVICTFLQDADVEVVALAASLCERNAIADAIPDLMLLLNSSDSARRWAATAGFGPRVDVQSARERLLQLLTDADDRVRIGVIEALGRIARSQTADAVPLFPVLMKLLSDDSQETRHAAASQVSHLRDATTTTKLIDLLDHPDPEVVATVMWTFDNSYRPMTSEQRLRLKTAREEQKKR